MNAIGQLTTLGQQVWLDNISRAMLDDGTLARYISDFGLVGLTSNPTIFQKAIGETGIYDKAILQKTREGRTGEALFFELAIEDLRRAADLFLPAHRASHEREGWVSLEVSPLLADNSEKTVQEAIELHKQAARSNLFIKIPGTRAGLKAITETIFHGVPINVTLLFSCEQYLDAAHAYMVGIERRLQEGLDPRVHSVASLFISRWDVAVKDKVGPELQNRLGIAMAQRTYKAYRDLLESPRWKKLSRAGALPQELLWASTGTKDPNAPQTLYAKALAAPDTIDTLPEKTLMALAESHDIHEVMARDGANSNEVLADFKRAGINEPVLAIILQEQGAASFADSWRDLLDCIADKAASLHMDAQHK